MVMATVIGVLFLITMAPLPAERDEGCSRCHSGIDVFHTDLLGPAEVPTDVEFEVSLVITNPEDNGDDGDDDDDGHPYTVIDLQAELDLSLAPGVVLVSGNLTRQGPDVASGNTVAIVWNLMANGSGEVRIRCNVSGTVYYDHSSGADDKHNYGFGPIEHIIIVKPLPIRLSGYSLSAIAGDDRSFEVLVTTNERLENLTFTPSSELIPFINLTIVNESGSVTPANEIDGMVLEPDEWLILQANITSADSAIEGAITISWTNESGSNQDINLTLVILERTAESGLGINWFSVSGQISGIFLIILFTASVILGGFPSRVRKIFKDRGIRARRRVELHCQVSYIIIALTIFHMLVLMAGPWGERLLDSGLVLGYIALGMMTGLGVHGAFQMKFIRIFGFKIWKRTHQILTIGVLIIALIHAVSIGTHFEFFRGLY